MYWQTGNQLKPLLPQLPSIYLVYFLHIWFIAMLMKLQSRFVAPLYICGFHSFHLPFVYWFHIHELHDHSSCSSISICLFSFMDKVLNHSKWENVWDLVEAVLLSLVPRCLLEPLLETEVIGKEEFVAYGYLVWYSYCAIVNLRCFIILLFVLHWNSQTLSVLLFPSMVWLLKFSCPIWLVAVLFLCISIGLDLVCGL